MRRSQLIRAGLLLALSSTLTVQSASYLIATVAGTGVQGLSGHGGPALSSELSAPSAVAVDASGNLYIADSSNNRIRKVTPQGMISTVAGGGTQGLGDGGPAAAAQLAPAAIAVDALGDLFIADTSQDSSANQPVLSVVRPQCNSS